LQALTAMETQKRIRRNGRKYLDTLKSRQEFVAAWEACTVTGTKEMQDQKLESMQRVVRIPLNVPNTMSMPQCLCLVHLTRNSSWCHCECGAQYRAKALITTEYLQMNLVGVDQVMPNHEWLPTWWEWSHDLDLLESMYMEGYDPRKSREFAEAFLSRPGSIYASLIPKVRLLHSTGCEKCR
jgi:hypothetical protein